MLITERCPLIEREKIEVKYGDEKERDNVPRNFEMLALAPKAPPQSSSSPRRTEFQCSLSGGSLSLADARQSHSLS